MWGIHLELTLQAKPRILLQLRCEAQSPKGNSHPPICFLSLAHRKRSVKRKTWRSLRAPSTSSTMKLSFSSCRCWGKTGNMFQQWQLQIWHWGSTALKLDSSQSKFSTFVQLRKMKKPLKYSLLLTLPPTAALSPKKERAMHLPPTLVLGQTSGFSPSPVPEPKCSLL